MLRERIVTGGTIREVKLEALETALHAAPAEFFRAVNLLVLANQVDRLFELALSLPL
jgi:hypothetical protein